MNNSFLVSNWSQPLVLPRNDSVNTSDCTMPQSSLTNTNTEPPFWVYILIASALFVTILLVCGIPVGAILHRNHKMKLTLAHVFKVCDVLRVNLEA